MKRKLEISELIFKIISYTCLTVFALCCLYPFVYAVAASISGREAVEYSRVVLFPMDIQFEAFSEMFNNNMFWNAYTNTLFLTFYGTIWALFFSILGGYALSKKRLLFRRAFNFFLVFTMWFSAGIVPQYLNYIQTQKVFSAFGITDDKWLVVIAMGMAAMNIILLRNAFEGVPSEIEEAAIVDGAGYFKVYHKIILPMIKPALATVAILAFQSVWNNTETSTMYTNKESMRTLTFYMSTLSSNTNSVAGQGMAAASSLIMFLPNLILFILCQSKVMNTMAHSGIK